MSRVSEYINAHTAFLNVFLPTLKAIVDELPLPPPVTAAFNTAYTLAPAVITTGAAALSELEGGKDQPAALALAGAFSGGAPEPSPADQVAPAVTVAPGQTTATGSPPQPTPPGMGAAPAPVQGAPATATPIAPPAQPPATAALPTLVAPSAPAPAPAPTPDQPTPAPAPVAAPASPLPILDPGQLAQIAASLGLQVMGPGGQIIPPGP